MKRPADSSSIDVDHNLEKAIPYLVTRAGTRMGNAFSKALKPYGLSLTEWRICASLGHRPRQTLSELVVHASVDMSALSRIVDRLVQQGLIRRAKSEHDGRAVSLSLTPEGASLAREIAPLAKHYEKVALTRFTAQEVEILRRLLIQLYDNAEQLE